MCVKNVCEKCVGSSSTLPPHMLGISNKSTLNPPMLWLICADNDCVRGEVDQKRYFGILLNNIKDLCWVAQINERERERERERDDSITWI